MLLGHCDVRRNIPVLHPWSFPGQQGREFSALFGLCPRVPGTGALGASAVSVFLDANEVINGQVPSQFQNQGWFSSDRNFSPTCPGLETELMSNG